MSYTKQDDKARFRLEQRNPVAKPAGTAPPMTYCNSTTGRRLVGITMGGARAGEDDHFNYASKGACSPQLQRVGA